VRVVLAATGDSLEFELATRESTISAPRPTVLIVDDNRDFLRLLSLEMSDATRWNVTTAQSPVEAEEISAGGKIDFALLDLLLPDGNGMELAAKLVEQQPGVQIAIMTGAELTTREEDECRNCNFDIVTKPFLPQQLITLVRERVFKQQARASA
jgi:DNA-binding NtrC family response regulator